MSYFDNANTNVTRKSFGSKVDKTFQREGVIPVKDRKKEGRDLVAESAKYKELNKKVDDRRMQEAKNARAFDEILFEGRKALQDELIKDFLCEICIESLLVDKPIVENNLKSITTLIEEKVDMIGGFAGVKRIAKDSNNKLLENVVSICEATCKKVGERNLREAKGNASLLDMHLNKIEMEEFGNRKKEIGSETIINHIKDKVYNVVNANGNIPAGTNYAWNGTSWDALGGDMSAYLRKEGDTSLSLGILGTQQGSIAIFSDNEWAGSPTTLDYSGLSVCVPDEGWAHYTGSGIIISKGSGELSISEYDGFSGDTVDTTIPSTPEEGHIATTGAIKTYVDNSTSNKVEKNSDAELNAFIMPTYNSSGVQNGKAKIKLYKDDTTGAITIEAEEIVE